MADEPYENPEHFSFKEKLKRFQNKDIILSDPTKGNRRPNWKVKVFPNAKDQEAKTGPAIHKVPKHDFSSGGSRTTLMKQDSCEVASDYLENFAEEIKDSDFLDEICDLQRSPVSEEILTSSDSCSKITVSCSSHRETKRDIATCTVDHEPQLDDVDADHVSDRFQDENKSERKDSSDRAPAPPPYPAAPYPLIDFKPFTGRSMSVGSCPPIGFEGLCDNPALSTTFPGLRSHIGDTSTYPSNYMIEPKLGMPLPDFAGLRSNKDS